MLKQNLFNTYIYFTSKILSVEIYTIKIYLRLHLFYITDTKFNVKDIYFLFIYYIKNMKLLFI